MNNSSDKAMPSDADSQTGSRQDGFAGTLRHVDLIDLIQMCCLSNVSLGIRVSRASESGSIFIHDGKIVHAVCNDLYGENAFYRIMAWQGGSFETLNVSSFPETTIDQNYQFLLIEAARIADESAEQKKASKKDPLNQELRVLIVDDSTMMRRALSDMIASDKRITVAGTAKNGEDALGRLGELKPDIITLDVNMPVMNGNSALKHIMIQSPCPVIIISSLGEKAFANIFDFMRLGAVDFIKKPDKKEDLAKHSAALVKKIFTAAMADIDNFTRVKAPAIVKSEQPPNAGQRCEQLIIISSGVGGYAELIRLAPFLRPDNKTGLIIFQDMPLEFTEPVADYLNRISMVNFMPLTSKSELAAGCCYLTPHGSVVGYHNDVSGGVGKNGSIFLEPRTLFGGDNGSMLHLFCNSVAESFAGRIMLVALSGADVGNISGLRNIRKKGGQVIMQRLDTCLLSHPLETIREEGLADHEMTPDEIAKYIGGCA